MKLLVDNKIPFFREYLKKIKNYDQFIIKYFDNNNLENDLFGEENLEGVVKKIGLIEQEHKGT